MYLTRKVRQVMRGLLQMYGTEGMKRSLWNNEFAGGRWNCLDSTANDCVYPFVQKYAAAGSILDLGCGSGSTGNELPLESYRQYVGVDISDAAIEKAKVRTDQNRRADRNVFLQSDVFRYVPTQAYDVILFRDSIYYVPRAHVKAMLDRYSASLTSRGVFIARIAYATDKYQGFVDTIERHFAVVERVPFQQPDALVIVFRPFTS
jgi:SAM-dependent methyltransferase